MPDFGQPGWNRAAVLQLPRIRLQRELGHGGIFRRICCWWTSTDGDDFLGSSWHSNIHVYTFSLNWRKSNWILSLIHNLTSPGPIIIGLLLHSLFYLQRSWLVYFIGELSDRTYRLGSVTIKQSVLSLIV